MNDESRAKSKTSMKITDGQTVSWGTVKGTILNYIKKNLTSAIPNTKNILVKLENEYALYERNKSDTFKYRNSVSGIINKISGKAQDWPSSSAFSYINGNKVILITLAGVLEYDKSDVKQTPSGETYINNVKAHFFNGMDATLSICPSTENGLTRERLETGDFNCEDIRLFPAIHKNTKVKDINDVKASTAYELSCKNVNSGTTQYYKLNTFGQGISISNLDDNNIIFGSLLRYNPNALMNKDNLSLVCAGQFANFMPYGDVSVGYSEIDGSGDGRKFQADGCGGIYSDESSSVNIDYIVNNFVNTMSDANIVNDDRISEVSRDFRSALSCYQQTNIGENKNDHEIGDRYAIIHAHIADDSQDYYHIKTLFNGKYVEQIVKHDDNGNYLIANKNLNRNATDGVYEVQLGNGNLFVGVVQFNDQTGDVYFMEGKFFNKEGKVIDNKKQMLLKEASSLPFHNARDINENDLKEFELSDRIVFEKGENGYDVTIIGTSFENTIKNDKVFSNYTPSLQYIENQLSDVEKFINVEIHLLNSQPEETYKTHIEQIEENGLSKKLIKDIRKATKDLYAKTKERTYTLSDGKLLTKERLSAFYSQLSQWQYLYNMRNKLQSLNGDIKNNNKQTDDDVAVKNNNNEIKEKPKLDVQDDKNNKATDEKNTDDTKQTITPNDKNLLKQSQKNNNDSAKDDRYPQILHHNDLTVILNDMEANQLASESPENKAIFSNIMKNVIDTENDKINLFIKTCQLLHESRGAICENGNKILPLSQTEYEELMRLNNRLTDSMEYSRNQELYKQVQSYHIEITDEHENIKDDFNKSMQFALSGEMRLNNALHAKNCKLFDELDKTGEIKRCCNDILYERDVNGENINKQQYSGYYNAYENKNSLNTESSLNINSTQNQSVDNII